MAYLAATELAAILPQNVTITGTSVPLTDGEVDTIIAQVGADFDAVAAAAGYTVPIPQTATVAYAQTQGIVEKGAAGQVLGIIFPNGLPLASTYQGQYAAALMALRKGELKLVGAPEDTSETVRALPRSYSESNPSATVGVLEHMDTDTEF